MTIPMRRLTMPLLSLAGAALLSGCATQTPVSSTVPSAARDCPQVGGWGGTQGSAANPAALALSAEFGRDGRGTMTLSGPAGTETVPVSISACSSTGFTLSRPAVATLDPQIGSDSLSFVFATDGPDTFRSTQTTDAAGERIFLLLRR